MGLFKGTMLAGMGIAGWLLEETFGYVGGLVTSTVGLTIPPEVAWMGTCAMAIVFGDLLTTLAGEDVSLGKKAGLVKGSMAAFGGLLGVIFAEGLLVFVASIWIPTVVLDYTGY